MNKYIYLDIETDGLIERGQPPNILCVGWWDGTEGGILTDLNHLGGVVDGRIPVFHKAAFDVAVLYLHNITFWDWEDTMLMAYLWDMSKSYLLSLADQGELVGVPKMNKPWGEKNPTEFSEELATYCLQDCKVTQAVHQYYQARYKTDPKVQQCYEMELDYQKILMEMERTGLHIDKSLLKPIEDELAARMKELEIEARGYVATAPGETKQYKRPRAYDDSDDSVGNLKFWKFNEETKTYYYKKIRALQLSAKADKLYAIKQLIPGWVSPEKTDKGDESLEGSVLKDVDHPIAEVFLEYSEISKLHGTYVSKIPKILDDYGFVHGTFNQCTTITGRLSSSEPNLQNIPAHSKTAKLIRAAFDAPEGWRVWDFDLSNMEARILAWLCYKVVGATTMVDIFINKLDFHQENCNNWGFNDLNVDDPRYLAKKCLFSDLYGVTAPSLARQIRQPVKLVEQLQEQVKAAYPEIQATKEWVWQKCRDNDGLMHTPLGRRLYYPHINAKQKHHRSRAERQVFNAMIQSTQADILKLRSIELMPIITNYKALVAAAVHDEKLGYVREEVADDFCNDMQTALCADKYIYPVPVVSECRHGANWQEAH